MIVLLGFPKNKEKFVKLTKFFEELLDICNSLHITPILDGSFAVFAYTGDQNMDVHDIDASIPESDFPRLIKIFEERGISYEVKEWHVLQVLKDDLKIELGAAKHWLKELPTQLEILEIDGYKINMLTLKRLKEFYRQAMEDRSRAKNPGDKVKYERLKEKYDMLAKL